MPTIAQNGIIAKLPNQELKESLSDFLRPLTASHTATGFLTGLDFQMMVVVCCSFGGGLILAGIAASSAAAARLPNSLYRITPEAERQFLEDLNATQVRRPAVTLPHETA